MDPATLQQHLSKPFSVSSLLSPPETRKMDNFASPSGHGPILTPLSSFNADFAPRSHQLQTPQSIAPKSDRAHTDSLPPSPPISPSLQKEASYVETQEIVNDPELFEDQGTIGEHVPLFAEEVVDKHISASPKPAPLRPTKDEYLLAVSCVAKAYNRDPRAWLAKERELLKLYGPRNRIVKRTVTASHSQSLRRLAPASTTYQTMRKPKPLALPRLPRAQRPARAPRSKDTPRSQASDTFDLLPEFTSTSPRQAKAPSSRDDVDYASLPDYCPPVDTLPSNNSKSLSVDWRVGTIDLSQDPDRHLLHEAEVYCASRLRLSCATYLCSKRRIFQARLNALRIGKEFRKTDAQQACKIDVNKASKLWTAFERVGWFEARLFAQHL